MTDITSGAAEKMDGIYRHQRFVYDLTRHYYLLGRDRLIAELEPSPADAVLEVGCGTGRNLIRAARHYPRAVLAGIDVSSAMLETATRNIARARLAAQIQLAAADACAFDPAILFEIRAFDRIFISYALSMIPDWPTVVTGVARRLATAGSLHIVDFGEFDRCPAPFAAGMRHWLRRFHVTPIADFESKLAILAASHDMVLQFERPFRGYAAYAILRRRPTNVPSPR